MTDEMPGKKPTDIAEERDPALNAVLRKWRMPDISPDLDRRILENYRNAVRAEPLWRRFFSTSVRVPLPVAVAALMLLFLAAAVAIRRPPAVSTTPPAIIGAGGLQAARAEPPVVVHTSLEGFQPVSDATVTVMEERRK